MVSKVGDVQRSCATGGASCAPGIVEVIVQVLADNLAQGFAEVYWLHHAGRHAAQAPEVARRELHLQLQHGQGDRLSVLPQELAAAEAVRASEMVHGGPAAEPQPARALAAPQLAARLGCLTAWKSSPYPPPLLAAPSEHRLLVQAGQLEDALQSISGQAGQNPRLLAVPAPAS